MVNPISDLSNSKPLDASNAVKAKQQEVKDLQSDANTLPDSVRFSTTSKQLEALKASLRDTPEINEARVLYFKAEIQSGNYQINSDRIANNMLNNVEMA